MMSALLLREARLRAGLTQLELATRAGTRQSAVARYERGEVTPSFEQLRRLVRACGLELSVSLGAFDDSYEYEMRRLLELASAARVEEALARGRALQVLAGLSEVVGGAEA